MARAAPRPRCPSVTSPTACTCRPGSRPQMAELYDTHLGPRLAGAHPRARDLAAHLHARRRRALGGPPAPQVAADRLRAAPAVRPGARRRGEHARRCADASRALLDRDALTIGFARRFATYKRADLLLDDEERLAAPVNDRDAPRAVHLRGQGPPGATSRASPRIQRHLPAQPRSALHGPAGLRSRTTTSTSAATWSRAWTSGSTRRAGRWRPAAPAA